MPRLLAVLVASVTLLLTLASSRSPADSLEFELFARPPELPQHTLAAPLARFQPPLPPRTGAEFDKLLMKYDKRMIRWEAAKVDHASAGWAHQVASEDLDQLLLREPPAAAKTVKLATSAQTRAAQQETRAARRLSRAQGKLDAAVANIQAIHPGWSESSSIAASSPVQVPLVIQEARPGGVTGVERLPGVATFGLPFALSDAVQQAGGRPELAVLGADAWQFRTLDTWPDGSVRWALCDVMTELDGGQALTGMQVVSGSGQSPEPDLGFQSTDRILLDTGPLQAVIFTKGFNLFRSIAVDGEVVVFEKQNPGIVGQAKNGKLLVPGSDTQVYLEENGPARAVVRADGTLINLSTGAGVIDFTCRVTARRGSRDLEVTLTVKNATIERPQHTIVESINLSTRIRTQNSPRASAPYSNGWLTRPLQPHSDSRALLYQAKSTAKTAGIGAAQYLPHLPTTVNDNTSFVQEGYLMEINGQTYHQLGGLDTYPTNSWLDISSPVAGMTLGIKQMAYQWPAALEAAGEGTVLVGLFPRQNLAPYTFVWRQHESRSAVFSFHTTLPDDPAVPVRKLDAPLTGRAADYAHYDRAGVFAYDLLTHAEHLQALGMMGISHNIVPKNPILDVTRYLYKGTTGGANNQAGIEISLGGDWLRYGLGGEYLNGLNLALYKSEWQIQRSDDFDDSDDPGAVNGYVPHSTGFFGDDEHRYREGIALAYYLTGDGRFRDALFDEAEILVDVSIWPHERSTYQTLRAVAQVAEFTDEPALLTSLRDRLAFVTSPVINIQTATTGFGWEAAPGQGARGCYVNSGDNKSEKPPGENFQARGFISASLGPLGFFHASRALPGADPLKAAARGRLRDLSKWTRLELFPFHPDPSQQQLAYSYAITLQQATKWENTIFHPILLGMAETWRDTGDAGYLLKGAEQLRAAAAQGDLHRWNTRLDVQHFLSAYRDWKSN